MKIFYYAETDSLYIELKAGPGTETREIAEGLTADFDADGAVVGLDIDHASTRGTGWGGIGLAAQAAKLR